MTREMRKLAERNRDVMVKIQDLTEQNGEVMGKVRELTQNTVDDSAVVSVITVVSAIYLPGSFVAVSNPRLMLEVHRFRRC